MIKKAPISRQLPGIISYMQAFSSKKLAYLIFFGSPLFISLISTTLNYALIQEFHIDFFFEIFMMTFLPSFTGVLLTSVFFIKKAPILRFPPKGWTIQLNTFIISILGGSYLVGQFISIYFNNAAFQEVFLILGTILAYILAFVIYFSFTTVEKNGYLFLSLAQPVTFIILYGVFTEQVSISFFIKAIIFFSSCAFIFYIFYARKLFYVSNIHKEATGIVGYRFIRAFILSMMTDGNDHLIEDIFDRVGVFSNIKIQCLFMRSMNSKKIKGIFFLPNIHFGPFKTCGSSDLPEAIYRAFKEIPGATVYHTTNDHSLNLTTQKEVDRIVEAIKLIVEKASKDPNEKWIHEVQDVSRKMSNTAKLIGTKIDDVPIIFLTRHPLPSDDIEADVGEIIREKARARGFRDVMIIDAHNSIIGDEILIEKDSLEAKDLINVAENFFKSGEINKSPKNQLLYGVAKDPVKEFSERDGIGIGGIVVHLFQNSITKQKTAFIHFDANNAFVDIRSYVLNMLQNRGIERGEITTSDSHTVARQFSSRGYSPLGDKISLDFILERLAVLLNEAEKDLEPVEFLYKEEIIENVRIWGNKKYFDVIMDTLQECIRVSQRLLSFSLIIPTFFSLILLLFYYNIQLI
ncbi:MAG: DUF2070 family protein [Promethearchaeota archaeon]